MCGRLSVKRKFGRFGRGAQCGLGVVPIILSPRNETISQILRVRAACCPDDQILGLLLDPVLLLLLLLLRSHLTVPRHHPSTTRSLSIVLAAGQE